MVALIRSARLCTFALALALCSSPAYAQQPDASASDVAAARDLFRSAARFAQEGKWEEARSHYERSYALRPSALTRYSLGLAQKETGRLVEAVESFRAFLRAPGDATTEQYRPAAEQAIRELEPRLAALLVRVPDQAAGIAVIVDGKPLLPAAFGVRRPVDPGHHRIEASAKGFKPFSSEIQLSEAGVAEVKIELAPDPGQAASTLKPDKSDGSPEQSAEKPRTLGLVLAISGGALFAGGATLGVLGIGKARDAETSDGSDADSARKLALVGDVLGGVGLVTAAIGTWLLVAPRSEKKQPAAATTAVSPWAGTSSAGLSVSGRF